MHTIWSLTLTFFAITSYTHGAGHLNPCSPPESVCLKLGQEGIIKCVCHDSISLFWYFGNDTTAVDPFIYKEGSVKYGPGYSSGEYDINVNGSLVITNVLSTHQGTYTVVIIEPGNPRPLVEIFTVNVYGPEETGGKKTYNCNQERKTANAEKVTTIATDDLGQISTSSVNQNGEQFLHMEKAYMKSFQAEIDHLKRLDYATLALLVIALISIGLVAGRRYTAKLIKDIMCKEKKAINNGNDL